MPRKTQSLKEMNEFLDSAKPLKTKKKSAT